MADTIIVQTKETQVVEVGIGVVGPGVPAGGTDGQVLSKVGTGDYNTEWQDPYTDADARNAISVSAPLSYNNSTGAITAPGLAPVATSGSYTDLTNAPVAKANISTSSTAQAIIATLAATASKAFKLLCKAQTSTKTHAAEFLVVHDGTSVYMTSYGEVFTSTSLGTWDAGFDAGLTNIRFYFTPASSTATNVFLTYVPL